MEKRVYKDDLVVGKKYVRHFVNMLHKHKKDIFKYNGPDADGYFMAGNSMQSWADYGLLQGCKKEDGYVTEYDEEPVIREFIIKSEKEFIEDLKKELSERFNIHPDEDKRIYDGFRSIMKELKGEK